MNWLATDLVRRGHKVVIVAAPQQCRDSAAARFPIRRTALAYLDLYSRILDGETLS